MANISISVVIPCKNEAESIPSLLEELTNLGDLLNEIIVVNDGSTDNTADICKEFSNVTLLTHQYSVGNGAAIKSGARAAKSDFILLMDADGQHRPEDIPKLVEEQSNGYDMVVGAREDSAHASGWRLLANKIYNRAASYMTGHKIPDLTSGFRLCNRKKFIEFIQLLPNGFSYPTTITMAFFRSGYGVSYIPVNVEQRDGDSHISVVKDGIKFLLIIFKTGTLYAPLKFFAPLSLLIFSTGFFYYLYTFITVDRFTNMSLLLLATSVFIFIFGLISEQITMLTYLNLKKDTSDNERL